MPPAAHRRVPINCEPCRSRKIRCPRDATPCGTCRRRGISSSRCVYARHPATNPISSSPRPYAPLSPASVSQSSNSVASDADLVERVRRLEKALQLQNREQSAANDLSTDIQDSENTRPSSGGHRATSNHGELPNKVKEKRQIGHLHTLESGHVRYVPHSLPWGLTSLPSVIEAYPEAMSGRFGAPPIVRRENTLQTFLDKLPPVGHCEALKNVYFASFSPLLHLLHDPTFHQQYSCFVDDPSGVSLSWLALLFAILATAVSALDEQSQILHDQSRKSTVLEKIDDLSEKYRLACFQCLEADDYMWRHNVTTLQTLIILIHGINNTHGQSWTLLGLAHNLALSLGCHIDPSYFHLDSVKCEERRRCWAGLMMLYTIQNTCLGNLGLPRVATTVQDPADVDDDQLIPGQPLPIRRSGSASQMSYLLLKFRLYNICSDVCEKVLVVSNPDQATINELDARIQAEQEHWEIKYLMHTGVEPLPLAHAVHINILYGYSHQLSLLLHRQALRVCSFADSVFYESSWEKCLDSARRLLSMHKAFHESTQFTPFSWYNRGLGSFHAFHGAITLIEILADCEDTNLSLELTKILEDCERRFHDMANLSPVCKRAAPIIRHMMSIVGSMKMSSTILTPRDAYRNNLRTATCLPSNTSDLPSTLSDSLSNNEDLSRNLDFLFENFRPQQLLSPAGIPWDEWDSTVPNMTRLNKS